jgi:hypothetical protein
METNKIEHVLLRLINRDFPFIEKVRFRVNILNDVELVLYVDKDEVCDKYNAIHIKHSNEDENYLHDLFIVNGVRENILLREISSNLEEVTYNLALPFVKQYCHNMGIPDSENVIIQYRYE